jgi:antitoxin component HigA of HigAB toxin-antitoxin module
MTFTSVIETPTAYANALQRIEELMKFDPVPGSPLAVELNILIDAVIKYESIHYPI